MSSGRDEWMSTWSQEDKNKYMPVKTHLERMVAYRDTLLAEVERLNYHIKELQDEQEKTI